MGSAVRQHARGRAKLSPAIARVSLSLFVLAIDGLLTSGLGRITAAIRLLTGLALADSFGDGLLTLFLCHLLGLLILLLFGGSSLLGLLLLLLLLIGKALLLVDLGLGLLGRRLLRLLDRGGVLGGSLRRPNLRH